MRTYIALLSLLAALAFSEAAWAGYSVTYTAEPDFDAVLHADRTTVVPGGQVHLWVTGANGGAPTDYDTKWIGSQPVGQVLDGLQPFYWAEWDDGKTPGRLDVTTSSTYTCTWTAPPNPTLSAVTYYVGIYLDDQANYANDHGEWEDLRTIMVTVLPNGVPSGGDVSESFGTATHLDLSRDNWNSNTYWPSAEQDSFANASRLVRDVVMWQYTCTATDATEAADEGPPGSDGWPNYDFTPQQGFTEDMEDQGVRPILTLIPFRETVTYYFETGIPRIYHSIDYGQGETGWGHRFAGWAKQIVEEVPSENVIWELVNEPQGWNLTASNYADLCGQTLQKIRAESSNPDATVVLGDVAEIHGDIDWPYLEEVLQKLSVYAIQLPLNSGSGRYIHGHTYPALQRVSAITVHPYRFNNPPEQAGASLNKLRMLLHKYSPEREIPLIFTEQGHATETNSHETGNNVSWATQARYMARQRLFDAGERVAANAWNCWNDSDFFDGHHDGYNYDPTEQAFGRFVETRWGMVTDWVVRYDFEDPNLDPAGWSAGSTFGATPTLTRSADPGAWNAHGAVYKLSSYLSDQGSVFVGLNPQNIFGSPFYATRLGLWIRGDTSDCTLTCGFVDSAGRHYHWPLAPSPTWLDLVANHGYSSSDWRYLEANPSESPISCDEYPNGGFPLPIAPISLQRPLVLWAAAPTSQPRDIYLNNITYTLPPASNWAKPSYEAAERTLDMLSGYHFVRYLPDPDPKKYVMLFENDTQTVPTYRIAAWTRDSVSTSYYLGDDPVTVTDMYGNSESRRHGDIPVSEEPVYVTPGSQYASRMADLASWSWAAGSGTVIGGDRLRDSVIMGGVDFETAFTVTNPTSSLRHYWVKFYMQNPAIGGEAIAQPHDVSGASVTSVGLARIVDFSIGAEQAKVIPVTLTTYLRTATTSVTFEIRVGTSWETGTAIDSGAIPLILGNPLTVTAGPLLATHTGGLTEQRLAVGIEAPGYTLGETLTLSFVGSGFTVPSNFDLQLSASPTPTGFGDAYTTQSATIATPWPTAAYSYTVTVSKGGHVLASAGNKFLPTGLEYPDPFQIYGIEEPYGAGWPLGLTFNDYAYATNSNDPSSAAWTKQRAADFPQEISDVGVLNLSIDYTRAVTDTTENHAQARLMAVVEESDARAVIPDQAKAIGMWVNPHGCMNMLMANFFDSDSSRENFLTLYGKSHPVSGYEENFERTQDSHLLDWDGWRFVTMPFDTAFSHWGGTPNHPEANRPLKWVSPFYLAKYYDLGHSVDITGVRYVANPD